MKTPAVPKRIQSVVKRFAKDHPKYSTTAGAKEKCREASGKFCDYLEAAGIEFDGVDECDVVDGMAHKAVRIGTLWIDWTARQFDAKAPWPKIFRD